MPVDVIKLKLLFKSLRIFMESLIKIGTQPNMDRLDLGRIMLLNTISLITIFISLLLTIITLVEGLVIQPLITFLGAFALGITNYLTYRGQHVLARNYFQALGSLLIISECFAAYSQGFYTGTENVLFAIMANGMFLYSGRARHWQYWLFYAILIALKFYRQDFIGEPYNLSFIISLQNATILAVFLYIFLVFSYNALARSLDDLAYAITKLEEIKIKLEKANESKDKIFSIVTHDLKSPLHSFESILSMTRGKLINSEDFEFLLKQLESRFVPIKATIEDLLNWSSSNLHDESLTKTEFEPIKVINEILAYSELIAAQKQIEIKVEGLSRTVHMDYSHLKIAIRNILHNAIKFSSPGSVVTIIQKTHDDIFSIEIVDSGTGMSEAILNQIKKGISVSSTRGTIGEGGSGVGLSLVNGLLAKNGCRLDVTSKEGHGTSFKIIIPTLPS